MSDFFTRLAGRALRQTPVLEPLVAAWTAPLLDDVEPELEQPLPARRPRVAAEGAPPVVAAQASESLGHVAVRGRLEAAGSAAGPPQLGSGPESSVQEVKDGRAVVGTRAEGQAAAAPRVDMDETPRPRRQAEATVAHALAAEDPVLPRATKAPAAVPATTRREAGVDAAGLGPRGSAQESRTREVAGSAEPMPAATASPAEPAPRRREADAAAGLAWRGSYPQSRARDMQERGVAAPATAQMAERSFTTPPRRGSAGAVPEPTITVSIGRIEVRAAPQRVPLPMPAEPGRPRTRPKVSLDDYLAQRTGSHR